MDDEQRLATVISAARAFLLKVDTISSSDAFRGAFGIAAVHGFQYSGANWEAEREALIEALRD